MSFVSQGVRMVGEALGIGSDAAQNAAQNAGVIKAPSAVPPPPPGGLLSSSGAAQPARAAGVVAGLGGDNVRSSPQGDRDKSRTGGKALFGQ
jgi:hypothetical protein